MSRIRLDKVLIKRNFAYDSKSAELLLSSGQVIVNGAIQTNPASYIDAGDAIEVLTSKPKYVSRGGYKLEAALDGFKIDLDGKRCLDVGASTGGFTDCMLEFGAKEVVSIDVGKGQLDDKIRHHPQVKVFERLNAKDLTVDLIGGECNFASVDVSFTSVRNIIDAVLAVLVPKDVVVLIKPQFELPPKYINARGIVQSKQAHFECISELKQNLFPRVGMIDLIPSPLTGTKGNIEFLAHFQPVEVYENCVSQSKISEVVNDAHKLKVQKP